MKWYKNMEKALSLFMCSTLLLFACNIKSYGAEEPISEQRLSLTNEWHARVSMQDTQGASACLTAFSHIVPDIRQWTSYEILLVADTMRMQYDTKAFAQLIDKAKEASLPREKLRILYERYAWATLSQGLLNSHPRIRFEAVLGAAMSGDSRAVPMLVQGLSDDNMFLRQFALEAAQWFPDTSIQEKLKEIAKSGNKMERLQAIELLLSQEAIGSISLAQESATKEIWTMEERAHLISLISRYTSQRDGKGFSPAIFHTLISSHIPEERLAALSYASQFPSPEAFEEITEKLLPSESQHIVILKALELLGCHLGSLQNTCRTSLEAYLSNTIASPIHALQARSAWCLYLLSSENSSSRTHAEEWFSKALISFRERPQLHTLAIAHMRGLGKKGVSLATQLYERQKRGEITLPDESQATLGMYLIEQRAMPQEAAQLILQIIRKPRSDYWMEDSSSLGTTFSYIAPAVVSGNPLIPRMKESTDLYIRLKLLLMASQVKSSQISADDVLPLIYNSDCFGIEYQAIQLLYGELQLPCSDVTALLSSVQHAPVERQLYIAAILASLSRKSEALHLIREMLSKENLSKEALEMILAVLAQFPLEETEDMISPYLTSRHMSLRTRAAGAYVSSLTQ